MGVSDADGQSWKEIAQAARAQAERAEHLLTHYLSCFDYDTERAGDFVRDFGRKIEQGDIRISDYVPGLAAAATPEAEDEALLCSLRNEGPSLLPALARLLADRPATADRTTPRPAPESPVEDGRTAHDLSPPAGPILLPGHDPRTEVA